MGTIFFTGFPGFLGTALLPRVLAGRDDGSAACLVQPKYAALARRRLARLEAEAPGLGGRILLVEGDLAEPGMGLAEASRLASRTTEIYHLAAIYDLEVSRPVAMRVNVEGTRRVVAFARQCASLRRLHYVSTCYVSGRHPGVFGEADLDVGQRFNNAYEETKFLAEQEVQEAMHGGLPTTIYRPAIVVGDSDTGATQKYDGPYHLVRLLLRQPHLAFLPLVGNSAASRVTLIPRDVVIAAIDFLARRERSLGRVYQLADPDPPTVRETAEILAKALRKRLVSVRVPRRLAGRALENRLVRRVVGIPPALIDYFTHPTRYSVTQAEADLDGSGVVLPSFRSYAERIVSFVEENPDMDDAPMA